MLVKSVCHEKLKPVEKLNASFCQGQLLSKMESDLVAMNSKQRALASELGTELMPHLSDEDQQEVSSRYCSGQEAFDDHERDILIQLVVITNTLSFASADNTTWALIPHILMLDV